MYRWRRIVTWTVGFHPRLRLAACATVLVVRGGDGMATIPGPQ